MQKRKLIFLAESCKFGSKLKTASAAGTKLFKKVHMHFKTSGSANCHTLDICLIVVFTIVILSGDVDLKICFCLFVFLIMVITIVVLSGDVGLEMEPARLQHCLTSPLHCCSVHSSHRLVPPTCDRWYWVLSRYPAVLVDCRT